MTTLYGDAHLRDFHDVTGGSSTGNPNYSAGTGYDYVTGIGIAGRRPRRRRLVGTTGRRLRRQAGDLGPDHATAGSSSA